MPVPRSTRSAGPAIVPVAAAPSPGELMRRLLDAQRFVTRDLSLAAMHGRIVTAACDLADAVDAAVAVVTPDARWERAAHRGFGDRLVGVVPRPLLAPVFGLDAVVPGRGYVAALPLQVGGDLYGVLVIARRSGSSFGAHVEEALVAFAAAAGTALENAVRYDEARRSRDWLNASGEIARALLAGADADTLLGVVSRALYVAEADLGTLLLPTGDGRLRVAVSVGVGADGWRGYDFDPHRSAAGRAIAAGTSVVVPDVMSLASAGWANDGGYGPTMIAPLVDAKGIRGAVVLVRLAGRAQFTDQELDLASAFADQVAVALELNDVRSDAEAVRALAERLRIAQELHDNVIQRLFAIGMGMQGLANGALPEAVEQRLHCHVDALDETIEQIRDAVFGLRSGVVGGTVPAKGCDSVRLPHRAVTPPVD